MDDAVDDLLAATNLATELHPSLLFVDDNALLDLDIPNYIPAFSTQLPLLQPIPPHFQPQSFQPFPQQQQQQQPSAPPPPPPATSTTTIITNPSTPVQHSTTVTDNTPRKSPKSPRGPLTKRPSKRKKPSSSSSKPTRPPRQTTISPVPSSISHHVTAPPPPPPPVSLAPAVTTATPPPPPLVLPQQHTRPHAVSPSPRTRAPRTPPASEPGAKIARVKGSPRFSGIGKGRDKYSKLRKRLKCCSQQQLIDHLITLVSQSVTSEKSVIQELPPIDLAAYHSKSNSLYSAVLDQLPNHSPETEYDHATFRKCKKNILAFKQGVINMAKTLIEGGLWKEAIEYCVNAQMINMKNPRFRDPSHNKLTEFVKSKLQQFALKAAVAIKTPKAPGSSPTTTVGDIWDHCARIFPEVALKLGLRINERPSVQTTGNVAQKS